MRPVECVRCLRVLQTSLGKGPDAQGASGEESPVPYTFADLFVFKFGEYRTRPVVI